MNPMDYNFMPKMLLTIDMYKMPLPSFNIKGETHVSTHCGGCFTLMIIFVIFMFASLKLQHLLSKHNPVVNAFVDRDVFDENDVWHAGDDQDFMMAFAVIDLLNEQDIVDDPKFVKWYAEHVSRNGDEYVYTEVPMHKCTDEDMARFHKPNRKSEALVAKFTE